ncbi:MAG: hypothetical protein AAFY55_05905, partial [Bacteroidota bacterium]
MRAPHRTTSTPKASAAMAQSRGRDRLDTPPDGVAPEATDTAAATGSSEVEADLVCISDTVTQAGIARPYERRRDDPVFRPLRIYALDPTTSPREGGVATVDVPYEPLHPTPDGWQGALFRIDTRDDTAGLRYRTAPLDDTRALLEAGVTPSITDPAFGQQMVYAVCMLTYAAFRSALGRDLTWGFPNPDEDSDKAFGEDERTRLRLQPYAGHFQNAYYDQAAAALSFGYYRAGATVAGRNLPGGFVFTALSHDVVTHEATHALLDGLRARFMVPSNPDVLAFHESLADLVALFQRFSYPEVVRRALADTRGRLTEADVLTGLARQIAETTGHEGALRSALDKPSPRAYVDASYAPHARSTVLTGAVFEAFLTVFQRKARAVIRLATGGSGVLAPGHLPAPLLDALADKASSLAEQFLTMCVRAVDYCPPVDLEFGEFLRAALTADYDLVPSDPWGYREAWVDAFRRRGIYPSHVASLATDALLWRPPSGALRVVPGLDADHDPMRHDVATRLRQAEALRAYLNTPEHLLDLGLRPPGPLTNEDGEPDPRGGHVEPACIESVRASRRVGPDRQVVVDLVAEITQRWCTQDEASRQCTYEGGATLLLSQHGAVRYVIYKDPASRRRATRQERFIATPAGRRFWTHTDSAVEPHPRPFQLLHPRDRDPRDRDPRDRDPRDRDPRDRDPRDRDP